MRNPMTRNRQRGLSLIELMVALGIGAFLIAGVVQVFISNKSSERLETSLARLQENGRFALDLITDDLHRAQYVGCNTGDAVITNMVNSGAGFQGVRGFEKASSTVWSPSTLPANLVVVKDTVRSGTDVLQLQTGRQLPATITSVVNASSTEVPLDGNPGCRLQMGDRVLLSSCVSVHLFAITNDLSSCVSGAAVDLKFASTLNAITTIAAPYNSGSEVLLYEENFWYVADTGRDQNGIDVYALYRKTDDGTAQEMIEGVEALEIEMVHQVPGTDSMRYVAPSDSVLNSSLANLESVQQVRIALLMQGFERVRDVPDTTTYNLLGTDIDSVDNASATSTLKHNGGYTLRRVFSTTVVLRNAKDV
ncbi:MAG: hypothetical protein CSA53_06685 [Gammaproteobacteria bacterium]|nr:MAG: hypothetical protein CSA53_06685 [Gammaproteobacteria bacterium]